MAFEFGKKKSEITDSSSNYIRNFKKGETKVRFLQEQGDWIGFFEHFLDKRSFPCTEDRETCPGCTHDSEDVQRAPRRYATHVWLVDQDRVIPVKMGQRLSDRLTLRAERNEGTITSRDYIIIRSGSGLSTDYDVDQDTKYEVNIDALRAKISPEETIPHLLDASFREVWGDPEQYSAPKKAARPAKASPLRAVRETPEEIPDALKSKAERQASGLDEFAKDIEVTEEALLQMKRSQLVAVWNSAGFDGFDEDWDTPEIVAQLLKRAD